MENLEEYDLIIADYFDNKMSPEGEAAFMEQLGENAVLRARFEEELEMQGFFYKEAPLAQQTAQPAAPVISMAPAAPIENKRGKLFFMPIKTFVAVAACLLLIASLAVVYFGRNNKNNNNSIVGNQTKPGTTPQNNVKPVDTNQVKIAPQPPAPPVARTAPLIKTKAATPKVIPQSTPAPAQNSVAVKPNTPDDDEGATYGGHKPHRRDTTAANAVDTTATATNNGAATGDTALLAKTRTNFAKFYAIYNSDNDDPAAINAMYVNYRQGNYTLVINTAETTPVDNTAIKANGYLRFYKGLSYLAINSLQNAVAQFNGVLAAFGKTEQLYYKAEWYKVMALLKMNNPASALPLAKNITQSQSPYKSLALQLVEAF